MNRIYLAGIILLIGIGVLGCGQKASPQGGPRDQVPPTITGTSPSDSTLNFRGTSVRINFSEAIRKPNYGKEIFISPFIERPKIILSDNARKLRIDFEEELRPQTTYLVTLTDIQDNTEGNKLAETYILAFSTGDQLDSMEIKGSIISPEIGKSVEKMKILLYDADSIKNDEFLQIRPAYVTQSDAQGDFSFKYLRNAPYKILGVLDGDQSNTYNNPTEQIAMSIDTLLLFEDDSTNFTTTKLYAFLPDLITPRLRSTLWMNDSTLRTRFNKGLRLDSLKAFISDTLNQDSQEVSLFTYLQSEEVDVYMHIPTGREKAQRLHLSGLRDTLGQPLDTVVDLSAFRISKPDIPLLQKTKINYEKGYWEVMIPRMYRKQENWIYLTDTTRLEENRDTLAFTVEQDAFQLFITPQPAPDTVKLYRLLVAGEIADSAFSDSTFAYRLKWFDKSTFGTLNGSVKLDSPYAPPIILELLDAQKKVVRTAYDTTFAFSFLPKGNYSSRIILDSDSNGVWTTGDLKTRRLPEKIFTPTGDVEIRENWDFDDYLIEVRPPGTPKPEEQPEEESETSKEETPETPAKLEEEKDK
ncbi:MAG: Ig-like domain-containing protein [Bacteroidota bacterium]